MKVLRGLLLLAFGLATIFSSQFLLDDLTRKIMRSGWMVKLPLSVEVLVLVGFVMFVAGVTLLAKDSVDRLRNRRESRSRIA